MKQNELKMAKEAGFTIIHGEVWTTDSKGYQAHDISKPLNKFTELILASQAQPTPSESDGERAKAEQQYTITAFDYVKNPVGSSEWCIYWEAWQARAQLSNPQPTPSQSEVKIPTSIDEAKLMAIISTNYLQQFAPNELKQPTPSQSVDNYSEYERNIALREANHIYDSDSYFKARVSADFENARLMFEAGYTRAWQSYTNAHKLELMPQWKRVNITHPR